MVTIGDYLEIRLNDNSILARNLARTKEEKRGRRQYNRQWIPIKMFLRDFSCLAEVFVGGKVTLEHKAIVVLVFYAITR